MSYDELLKILYLFLDLFKLMLHLYDTVNDLYVLRFGADGVYFSAQFLDHKIEFLPCSEPLDSSLTGGL